MKGGSSHEKSKRDEETLSESLLKKENDGAQQNLICELLGTPYHLYKKILYLSERFGEKFMLMVVAVQWLQKGFGFSLLLSTLSYMYRDIGGVQASQLSIFSAMVCAPFALKPLMGISSDFTMFRGWQKYPYLLFWNVMAVGVCSYIGVKWYLNQDNKPIGAIELTIAGIAYTWYVATADLLLEAVASAKIRNDSENGPSMVSFLWAGLFAVQIGVALLAGIMTEHYSPWYAWPCCLIVSALAFPPTLFNWTGETPRQEFRHVCFKLDTEKLILQRRMVSMALFAAAVALGLTLSGFLPEKEIFRHAQIIILLGGGAILMFAAHFLLPKWIARTCYLNFITGLMSPSVSSAAFYFFTDTQEQYPEGPHFSAQFYISVIGIVGGIMNVAGIMMFDRFMKTWRYRSILVVCNVLLSIVNLVNILIYTRRNLDWGIPDVWFVLGEDVFGSMLAAWTYMPSILILTQLTPKGMEASSFAITAGVSNLGGTASRFAGAYLLAFLSVEPSGEVGESTKFENLWIASLVASALPILTIALIPLCVPEGRMTDDLSHLLEDNPDNNPLLGDVVDGPMVEHGIDDGENEKIDRASVEARRSGRHYSSQARNSTQDRSSIQDDYDSVRGSAGLPTSYSMPRFYEPTTVY